MNEQLHDIEEKTKPEEVSGKGASSIELPYFSTLQKKVNQSPLLNRNASLQRMVDNSLGVVQRSIIYTGSELVKGKRHNFWSRLSNALEVDSDEARCHLIPYSLIRDIIIKRVNSNEIAPLWDLLNAVFPNGGKAKNHDSDELNDIAAEAYAIAEKSIKALDTSPDELTANTLLDAMNNSPDNLRLGFRNTNSSIGGKLDFPESTLSSSELKAGTTIYDESHKKYLLGVDTNVLIISNDRYTDLVNNVYDAMPPGMTFEVYTSGDEVQSSDKAGMKTAVMTDTDVHVIALEWEDGWFLFDSWG